MPLITENVRKNADKCFDCAMMRLKNFDEKTALRELGASLDIDKSVFEKVVTLSCGACLYSEDFKKVYGVMPAIYFNMKK